MNEVTAQPGEQTEHPLSSAANRPWRFSRHDWWQILKRAYAMIGFHNVSLLAAGVAFYTFLALTPLLAACVLVYGLVADFETVRSHVLALTSIAPPDVTAIFADQLTTIIQTNKGVTGVALVVALFFSAFGAMRAATGMMAALTLIYEEHEGRSILRYYATAMGLTLASVLIGVIGLISASVFGYLQTVELPYGAGAVLVPAIQLLTWVCALMLGSLGFGIISRFGVDRSPAKWQWLAPGSLLATILWTCVSFGFSYYVAYITNYSATYGSLAAIVIFLMWIYLSAFSFLLGALINAEAERQTVNDTTTGPSQPAGQRGAVMADQSLEQMRDLHAAERRRRRSAQAVGWEASQSAS